MKQHRERLSRFTLPIALAVGVLIGTLIPVSQSADAFSIQAGIVADTPERDKSYCVQSTPPGVTEARAKTLLVRAIAHWEAAGGIDGNPPVDPVYHSTCQTGTDVRLRAYNISALAQASADGTHIVFDSNGPAWWDGIGTRGSSEWCYECVLVHEMGHTVGMAHSGSSLWTYDGSQVPSMTQCGSQSLTATIDSIEQDDWGLAANVGAAATNKTEFWNANPGFERGTTHWYRSNTSQIAAGSAYKQTGGQGVRMTTNGNYIYMTSVYDPYHPPNIELPGMDTTWPWLSVRTNYRHSSSGTTGGVRVQYNHRYLLYAQELNGVPICKTYADTSHSSWTGVITLESCGDQGTTWKTCTDAIQVDNSTALDASVWRAYVRSTSNGHLYIDKAGATGGVNW